MTDIQLDALAITIEGIIIVIVACYHLHFIPSLFNICAYIFLILISMHLTANIQSFILSLYVFIPQDSLMYNFLLDISQFSSFPYEIYTKPVFFFLTFIIPATIFINFPTRALRGILSWQFFVIAIVVDIYFTFFASFIWKQALRKYSSIGG